MSHVQSLIPLILSILDGVDSVEVKALRRQVLLCAKLDPDDKDSKKSFKRAVKYMNLKKNTELVSHGLVEHLVSTNRKLGNDKHDPIKREWNADGETNHEETRVAKKQKCSKENGEECVPKVTSSQSDEAVSGGNPCKGNKNGTTSTRLFVGYLPLEVDETILCEFLKPEGFDDDEVVTHLRWIKDANGVCRSAFVEMIDSKSAARAVQKLKKTKLMGRSIIVMSAPPKEGDIWDPKHRIVERKRDMKHAERPRPTEISSNRKQKQRPNRQISLSSSTNARRIAPECSGDAAIALEIFRELESTLKHAGRRKSDMIAYKELSPKWTPKRQHGHIPGVPVGVYLHGRGEAAILGLHRQIVRGIDSLDGESCYAICVSGGYVDDDDHRPDGSLVYTGVGGQKGRHQVTDQKSQGGNDALLRSIDTHLPIRVLRGGQIKGGGAEYFYDGLYTCISYTYEASLDGPKVYKFTLVPIEKESKRSIVVSPTRPPGAQRPRIIPKKKNKKKSDVDRKQVFRQFATNPTHEDTLYLNV
eukprot:CAMPEP_0198288370 /NCGR_PEP_ID=MMETSP1449-20131203/6877_1 /TAXON_ID=420275 /ORGANISM="Attheya septentrionalis, Strain CCMP2084" /LENGTH=529 /DNA_ID=CAMNT_0043986487 /DNA_START=134 /DNA_END=1723 /DNA_ORIENTATION=-